MDHDGVAIVVVVVVAAVVAAVAAAAGFSGKPEQVEGQNKLLFEADVGCVWIIKTVCTGSKLDAPY